MAEVATLHIPCLKTQVSEMAGKRWYVADTPGPIKAWILPICWVEIPETGFCSGKCGNPFYGYGRNSLGSQDTPLKCYRNRAFRKQTKGWRLGVMGHVQRKRGTVPRGLCREKLIHVWYSDMYEGWLRAGRPGRVNTRHGEKPVTPQNISRHCPVCVPQERKLPPVKN